MPIFGDYETFGEPIAITEDRGHVSTVWRARKIGKQGDPNFAIKCYAPHRRKSSAGSAEDALEKDPGQEFLAGIKQLQKAHNEGAHSLVPVHDLGFADEGAWYVTNFYPRNTLKAWIARRGGVDGAALKQVVQSVVSGCLALKRSRGFAHGNLKAANVFLVGKPRPLRSTPLHLADAYPAAPLQLARLGRDDRQVVDELLHQVIEVHDLRALGEILLQLVEGRLVTNAYDYNYPIASSPAWENLGRDGERWRDLCNRLIDPQLSLDKLSLEALAKEYGTGVGAGKLLVVVGVIGGVCLLAGGFYGFKQWNEKRNEKAYRSDLQAATNLFSASNFTDARLKITSALSRKPGHKDAVDFQKQIGERIEAQFVTALQDAENGLIRKKFDDAEKAIERLKELKPDDSRIKTLASQIADGKAKVNVELILTQKRERLKSLLVDARSSAGRQNWIQATNNYSMAKLLAIELRDSTSENEAQTGWEAAAKKMAELTNVERLRAQVDDWLVSGRAAQATNGWSVATNLLKQALDSASDLKDQNRINQASSELKKAEAGLTKYLTQAATRKEIGELIEKAKAAESQDWNVALESYSLALNKSQKLDDKSLEEITNAGIVRAKNGIEAQKNKARLQKEVNDLLAFGDAAVKTNGWREATNNFSDAHSKSISLQDQSLIKTSEEKLKKAQDGLTSWEKKQNQRLQIENNIRSGLVAEQSSNWSSATNFYALALSEAKQLADRDLEKKAGDGLQRAQEEIRKEALQKKRQDEVRHLTGLGDLAAETNGWATATNFFAQAMQKADKSKDPLLWQEADRKFQRTRANLHAEIDKEEKKKEREQAYKSATNSFAQGNYKEALEFSEKYNAADSDFIALVKQIQVEQIALRSATNSFQNGDYAFISQVEGREYKIKKVFAELLSKAKQEQAELTRLSGFTNQPNGWQKLQKELGGLPANVSGKAPFVSLRDWTTTKAKEEESAKEQALKKLDARLETIRKQLLGGKPPEWMTVPESSEKKINTEIELPEINNFRIKIKAIETDSASLLDKNRKNLIKALQENLDNR